MEFESIKSNKKANDVVEKLEVNEKDVVISKVKIFETYGIFPTDFSPLVLTRIMTGSKPRNAIEYKFSFSIGKLEFLYLFIVLQGFI